MASPGLYPAAATPYASSFAWTALANIEQEYPNKPDHVLLDPRDLRAPHELHPLFYGSFDWHSCVHMHWLLVRLLRCFPNLPERTEIVTAFSKHFTAANVTSEIAYLQQPARATFERTYGWAWLLKLQTELIALAQADAKAVTWRDALQPLADAIAERYLHFLPLAQYPIRAGTHANSAFALLFALDYAECRQHVELRKLVTTKAHAWFGRDHRYPSAYEPGGEDFLSPGLVEAVVMRRVYDSCSFTDWWKVFCPAPPDLQTWLTPVRVTERSDLRLAHLDGLNLSRAWCWKMIEPELPPSLRPLVRAAVDAHLAAAISHACSGDYAGTHWLASFALLALTDG